MKSHDQCTLIYKYEEKKLTKCPKVRDYLNKLCYIHAREYSAAIKMYSFDSNLVTHKML